MSYNAPQEEEAAWLSGCLLLPRPALLKIASSRMRHPRRQNVMRLAPSYSGTERMSLASHGRWEGSTHPRPNASAGDRKATGPSAGMLGPQPQWRE